MHGSNIFNQLIYLLKPDSTYSSAIWAYGGSSLPRLRFHTPNQLRRFLSAFLKVNPNRIPLAREAGTAEPQYTWLLRVRPVGHRSRDDLEKAWSVFPGLRVVMEQRHTLNSERYPDGVAHLRLVNMRKEKRQRRIKGSKALRRVLHICAVVAGSDKLLEGDPHASG